MRAKRSNEEQATNLLDEVQLLQCKPAGAPEKAGQTTQNARIQKASISEELKALKPVSTGQIAPRDISGIRRVTSCPVKSSGF